MNNLFPKTVGINFFGVFWIFGINWVLGHVFFTSFNRLHKIVVYFNRNVCSGNFSLFQFGIDERFGIRMFNRYGKHKRTTATILSNFAGRV